MDGLGALQSPLRRALRLLRMEYPEIASPASIRKSTKAKNDGTKPSVNTTIAACMANAAISSLPAWASRKWRVSSGGCVPSSCILTSPCQYLGSIPFYCPLFPMESQGDENAKYSIAPQPVSTTYGNCEKSYPSLTMQSSSAGRPVRVTSMARFSAGTKSSGFSTFIDHAPSAAASFS